MNDDSGKSRKFPGQYGSMISPNYDYMDGPYNGLPLGGESVTKFLKKKRKQKKKRNKIAHLSVRYEKILGQLRSKFFLEI